MAVNDIIANGQAMAANLKRGVAIFRRWRNGEDVMTSRGENVMKA